MLTSLLAKLQMMNHIMLMIPFTCILSIDSFASVLLGKVILAHNTMIELELYRWTDQQTEGWVDVPSCRDEWVYLKILDSS